MNGRLCRACGKPVAEHRVTEISLAERAALSRSMSRKRESHPSYLRSQIRGAQRECPGYEGAERTSTVTFTDGRIRGVESLTARQVLDRALAERASHNKAGARMAVTPIWRRGARNRIAGRLVETRVMGTFYLALAEQITPSGGVVADQMDEGAVISIWEQALGHVKEEAAQRRQLEEAA